MTEATFTELRASAAFDVVGSVGGPRPGLRLDSATDCTECYSDQPPGVKGLNGDP